MNCFRPKQVRQKPITMDDYIEEFKKIFEQNFEAGSETDFIEGNTMYNLLPWELQAIKHRWTDEVKRLYPESKVQNQKIYGIKLKNNSL